jgi:chemotaxis protein methyltransferase CheR
MKIGFSDNQLTQLSGFVASRLGLHFPPARWGDLERHARSAAIEFDKPDPETFLQWLVSSQLTQEQTEILASHLTIPETYFWREPQVFEALRTDILAELIRLRENQRRLRFWCAGCSTGEEPYSLAIALRQVLPALEDWNITLLATDINPRVLRRAAEGVYGEWSFRNVPAGFKDKYFLRRTDGRYEVLPRIRKMVTFAYLNLSEDVFPSPMNNTNAMDIIFCRNVLMYFAPARMRLAGQRFYQCLVEGGWFIVSSSELSQHIFGQFAPVNFPGAVLYRREPKQTRPMTDLPAVPFSAKKIPMEASPSVNAHGAPTREKITGGPKDPNAVVSIRELANQGKLDEAWSACEQAIALNKLDPSLYYLGAIILQEQNREADALAAFKRALYLDPNFIMAHFSLGSLLLRQGNRTGAKKSFKNVMELLNASKQDEPVPESEGLTAARIKQIVSGVFQTGGLNTL